MGRINTFGRAAACCFLPARIWFAAAHWVLPLVDSAALHRIMTAHLIPQLVSAVAALYGSRPVPAAAHQLIPPLLDAAWFRTTRSQPTLDYTTRTAGCMVTVCWFGLVLFMPCTPDLHMLPDALDSLPVPWYAYPFLAFPSLATARAAICYARIDTVCCAP